MKGFYIIVCVDKNFGISKNGNMPWKISNELKNFQNVTTNNKVIENIYNEKSYQSSSMNAIIMGRNTYETIGKKLSNRVNIILTKKTIDDNICFPNFNDALHYCQNPNISNIFVIGGEEVYNHSINHPLLIGIYMTQIDFDYKCDKFFNKNLLNNFYDLKCININTCSENDVNNLLTVSCSYNFIKININNEISYLALLNEIYNSSEYRQTRNGRTKALFGKMLSFDLNNFPILTTKKIPFRFIFNELKLFISGKTDVQILRNENIHIWDENTTGDYTKSKNLQDYDMGPLYGFQWRHFGEKYINKSEKYEGFDQLQYIIDLLKNDPMSRRIIMTSYNPIDAQNSVLYPCHGNIIQFYVNDGNKLSCHMYQRSADAFLGLPFNISSYALFTYILANIVDMIPDKLIISLGDVHIYENHEEQILKQLNRIPYNFPKLEINKKLNINDLSFENFELINYNCHPKLNAKMN